MSYKNYLARKSKRNARLVAYYERYLEKYPEGNRRIIQVKLGKIFKLSQSRVSRILARGKKDSEENMP